MRPRFVKGRASSHLTVFAFICQNPRDPHTREDAEVLKRPNKSPRRAGLPSGLKQQKVELFDHSFSHISSLFDNILILDCEGRINLRTEAGEGDNSFFQSIMDGPNNGIVLYHYSFSPYARRVIWYLALRGIDYAECVSCHCVISSEDSFP